MNRRSRPTERGDPARPCTHIFECPWYERSFGSPDVPASSRRATSTDRKLHAGVRLLQTGRDGLLTGREAGLRGVAFSTPNAVELPEGQSGDGLAVQRDSLDGSRPLITVLLHCLLLRMSWLVYRAACESLPDRWT